MFHPCLTHPVLWSTLQEESFATNVARLKEYRANLIIFPRGSKHLPKKGDSSVEEQAAATQVRAMVLMDVPFCLFAVSPSFVIVSYVLPLQGLFTCISMV